MSDPRATPTQIDCPNCRLRFWVTVDFEKERRKTGNLFYCPVGHSMEFRKDSCDEIKRKLEEESRLANRWRRHEKKQEEYKARAREKKAAKAAPSE